MYWGGSLGDSVDFGAKPPNICKKLATRSIIGLQNRSHPRMISLPHGSRAVDINLLLEPELAWVAREMLGAPMPPTAGSSLLDHLGVVFMLF